MYQIQKRIQRAAESILENEALSADLDDDSAKVLLDWGVSLSRQITIQTVEMDDAQAEQAMYRPMRALRKMLSIANKWTNGPGEKNLRRMLEQAPDIYGSEYTPPGDEELRAFMVQIPAGSIERLNALQRFIQGDQVDLASNFS